MQKHVNQIYPHTFNPYSNDMEIFMVQRNCSQLFLALTLTIFITLPIPANTIFQDGFEKISQLKFGILTTGKAGFSVSNQVLTHPDLSGFLIHRGWKDIEIQKGVFDWSYVDTELMSAVLNNKKVRMALHIGGDDTPKWLYDDTSIPFVLGKSGSRFEHINNLSFSGNTVSNSDNNWPGDLTTGKIIEITGTLSNDGRYRILNDTNNSITVEETFTNETNTSGTMILDVVPSYWDSTVIQHKSDFYNAQIAHVSSVGQDTLAAMLTFSISMVDPNTGDWSFINSPDHIQSYNQAGWLTGNDTEKQAGWDMFHAAMITMYDNVLPNVPASMFVASAVGPVPKSMLPIGTDKNKPVQNILNYVEGNYPAKVIIAKGALNARTFFNWPCPAIGSSWSEICDKPLQNFLQINWSVTSASKYDANGGHQWDKNNNLATATILKNAGISAYSYNPLWFEIWHADVDSNTVINNPDLQDELNLAIAYTKHLFLNGNSGIGAPIAVQIPDASITAALGTEFVLEYVFDYNGEVPDQIEVRKNGALVGDDLSYTITNPTANDSGLYEISCRNSAGTTTISTQITFQ